MSVNTEKTELTHKESVKHGKKRGVLSVLRVLIGVLLVAVIALAAALYLAKAGLIFRPVESVEAELKQPEPTPEEIVAFTASFLTPLGDELSASAPAGEAVALPEAPEIDGYRFLCWADEKGQALEESEIALDSDASFKALYIPSFRDGKTESEHTAYLSIDEDGFFHPDEPLSRAEAAAVLSSLLAPSEIKLDDDFNRAASAVTGLAAISGEEPVTAGELFSWLSAFFPKAVSEYAFDNIPSSDPRYADFCLAMEQDWIEDAAVSPDEALSRRAAARIFNRLSGRTLAGGNDFSKVGTILDVSFSDPDFWEIAEAAVPHEAERTEAGESWSASESLELRAEGLFFTGTQLRCIDEQGGAVVNGSYGNFDFGPDGVITTGMPELDALVQEKLIDLEIDPATMEREHMLRIIYDDVTYHNSYLGARKDQLHEVGDISWVNDAAYHMLTVKKGCCYNFAAEFYVLAKAIGYDAVIYSGKINPDPIQRAHGWVEIEFDGVPYIFDTELEYTQVITGHTGTVYYKISYERVKGWYYYRGE